MTHSTQLDKLFKGIDVNGKKVDLVQKLLKEATPSDFILAMETFNYLFEERLAAQDMESCAALFAVWRKNELKYCQMEYFDTYQKSVKKYYEIWVRHEKLNAKENLLQKFPDEPKLNREYAEALVLAEGNWANAMPYFAKGDDPELQQIARFEMGADDTLNNLQVGDLYWGASDKRNNSFGVLLKKRAAIFYEAAMNELNDSQKSEVKKRIIDATIVMPKACWKSPNKKRKSIRSMEPKVILKNAWADIVATTQKENPIIGDGKIINTLELPPEGSPIYSNYTGGVLLQDGNVLFISFEPDKIKVYDPEENIIVQNLDISPHYRFAGGVLLPNGNVVLIPEEGPEIIVCNPEKNKIVQTLAHETEDYFSGGVLLPNGNVVLIPNIAEGILVYAPSQNKIVAQCPHRSSEDQGHSFYGGVLTPKGNVVLIPRSSDEILVYDPKKNEIVSRCQHGKEGLAFEGGVLLPTGDVCLIPYYATEIVVYSPEKNVITQTCKNEKMRFIKGGVTSKWLCLFNI